MLGDGRIIAVTEQFRLPVFRYQQIHHRTAYIFGQVVVADDDGVLPGAP
jgi:hypothetical protein